MARLRASHVARNAMCMQACWALRCYGALPSLGHVACRCTSWDLPHTPGHSTPEEGRWTRACCVRAGRSARLAPVQVRAAADGVGRAQTRDVAGQAVCRRREVAEWRKEGRGNGAATDSSLTQSSWVWDPAQFFHVRYLGSKVVHKAIGSVSGRRKRRVV